METYGLSVWCASVEPDADSAFALFCRMADFIMAHPDVLESREHRPGGMSFPEIRSLIERNEAFGLR